MRRVPVRDLAPGRWGTFLFVYLMPAIPAGLAAMFMVVFLVELLQAFSEGSHVLVLRAAAGATFAVVYVWVHLGMRRHYAEGS